MNAKQQIQECRRLFGQSPGGLRRLLHRRSDRNYDLDCAPDQAPRSLEGAYRLLLEKGRVVWAAVVQADPAVYGYGSQDHPASIVYSLDPFFDGVPGELENIAHAICSHKLSRSKMAEFYNLAALLAEHPEQAVVVDVPEPFSPHHRVMLSWTLVHRRRLPTHYLASTAIPILVAPPVTEHNMILPLRYWPRDLQNAWHHLNRQKPPGIDQAASGGVGR